MKVYVVTSGSYSAYMIEKIFTDEQKAKEYKEWVIDSNDIEIYEINDSENIHKYYRVYFTLDYFDNGKENLKYNIAKTNIKPNSYIFYTDYHKYNSNFFRIQKNFYIDEINWFSEKTITKLTKSMYDILNRVKQIQCDNLADQDIEKIINQ